MPTITLPLTQGQQTVIDAEDWPRVSAYKWSAERRSNGFYAGSGVRLPDGRTHRFRLHRFLVDAAPGTIVDHIDGDTLNNTRANLRFVTASQNAMNRAPGKRNHSGYKGVQWHPDHHRWMARIRHKGTVHYLGYFRVAEDAARAYDVHARILHGPFARLNFPD